MVERTPKILIVDDDPRLRDLLRRYLGENGFNVLVSENGEAMKRLWVREHFDVLILDLMMPDDRRRGGPKVHRTSSGNICLRRYRSRQS